MSDSAKQAENHSGMPASQNGTESPVSNIIQKIFTLPVKVMVRISSIFLVVLMLVVTADVIGRYLFKHPVTGSEEIEGLLLLCAAVFAFSYAQRERRHIRIELLIEHLTYRSRLVFDVLNYLIGLAIISLISWQVFVAARNLFLNLQGGTQLSETLDIPWLPFMIILGIGFAIFALVILGGSDN